MLKVFQTITTSFTQFTLCTSSLKKLINQFFNVLSLKPAHTGKTIIEVIYVSILTERSNMDKIRYFLFYQNEIFVKSHILRDIHTNNNLPMQFISRIHRRLYIAKLLLYVQSSWHRTVLKWKSDGSEDEARRRVKQLRFICNSNVASCRLKPYLRFPYSFHNSTVDRSVLYKS